MKKTTGTKRLLAAMAALVMLSALAGCSDSDSSKDSDSKADSTSQSQTSDDSSKTDESKPDAPASNSADIEALALKIDELSNKIDDLTKKFADYDFGGDVHEIYDDTAVVEAFKAKDPSNLTDKKDKYIYDGLVKAYDEIIKDGMSDYEKELAVYDYIFYGTRFDKSNLAPIDMDDGEDNSHNPYGFFHDHSTICVGNATTFKLFMDVLGIDCEIIHSTEQGEHAWDIVKIDGDWYHVDITFDGGNTKPAYSFFNVTDATKSQGGYPWDPADFHECNSTKYNYAIMNAQKCKDVYDLPKVLKEAIDGKKNAVYPTFKLFNDKGDPAFTENDFYTIQNCIQSDTYFINVGQPIYNEDKTEVTIPIVVEDPSEQIDDWGDDTDDSPEAVIDAEKMQEKFEEVFGDKVVFNSSEFYYDGDDEYYEANDYNFNKVDDGAVVAVR
ncbi:MAG: hypothetical protein IKO44_01220 [Ruminococcus sp.]|nr:hypothetical protein [Ruminococcus sp.]